MSTLDKCPYCNSKQSFTFIDGFSPNRSYKTRKSLNKKTDVNLFIKHYLVITPIYQLLQYTTINNITDKINEVAIIHNK